MAQTEVVIYTEEDRTAPFVEWLDDLPKKAQDKCLVKIERSASYGHELRRPDCDYLRGGIYELRFAFRRVNYRVLYFFDGKRAVLSHGIVKERRVPDKEIDLALVVWRVGLVSWMFGRGIRHGEAEGNSGRG